MGYLEDLGSGGISQNTTSQDLQYVLAYYWSHNGPRMGVLNPPICFTTSQYAHIRSPTPVHQGSGPCLAVWVAHSEHPILTTHLGDSQPAGTTRMGYSMY